MSDTSFWCEHCEQFVDCAGGNQALNTKKLAIALLLCPIGFCFVPYLHPRFRNLPKCPICQEIIDDGGTITCA